MNIQRAPQARLRLTITNSIVNETNDSGASSSRNSHFTPCRRVGLSRKKAPNVQVNKGTVINKNEEPSSPSSQQMPTEKHAHKQSLNESSSMRKNDEANKSHENYRLQTAAENGKQTKQSDSDSDNETKYSHTPSYINQRENSTSKSRKKSKGKSEPLPREAPNDLVSDHGDDYDSHDERLELPESKKRRRESYNVNTVEHAGTSSNGISSIEIKNILTGIDPELAKIEESNSPSNLSLSSVKKISIHVKQKLEQNKWSTSTKVHLSQDDQAVSDVDSVAGNSDLSDFSESSSNKRKRRTSTSNKSRKSSPKPGPSRPNTADKSSQPSSEYNSDSEDDFVSMTKSRAKEVSVPIKSEPLSQPVIKLEKSSNESVKNIRNNLGFIKTQIMQDDLNKTEQIRIAKNKILNVIYKGNVISYVKSHDNDNKLKPPESDRDRENTTDRMEDKLSMIIEQKSYITERVPPDEEDGDTGEVDERSVHLDMFDNLELPPEPISTVRANSPKPKPSAFVPVKRSKLTLSKSRTQPLIEQPKIENMKKSAPSKSSTNPVTNETNTSTKVVDLTKLRKRYVALQNKIKLKQEMVEKLKRVSVYKKTHDLDELRAVTMQHKEGAQNSLFDMLLLLNSVSHEPCDMKTLLHNMKIPNELVDYNAEEDKFM